MRLPQHLLNSPYFLFDSIDEVVKAATGLGEVEVEEIIRLDQLGLPPVSSRNVLGLLFGLSSSLIWSFQNRTNRHYRTFAIPKGNKGVRLISAPRVGLKIIQKWIATQFQAKYLAPEHVFGFVAGRSHIDAASRHARAKWVLSVDIRDFFQTTPIAIVVKALEDLGYSKDSSLIIASLSCYKGFLPQGAPTSPVLSNICFKETDQKLSELANFFDVRVTRYADDIVFSGEHEYPNGLWEKLHDLIQGTPWILAPEKSELTKSPNRLKVHGLLVHGESVRLTKGYRNRIRAYKHLIDSKGNDLVDIEKMKGHIGYGEYVQLVAGKNA